jgi:GT2 family glycosyltransferase
MNRSATAPQSAIRNPQSAIPDVSVCVVNWNCREHLRACLRSLRPRLQKVRLEVIVVDNGSTDGAPEMVARRFPRVRLIRNRENAGFARANNQAAAVACGRFLFFLNNDTVVPPGTLRELLDYAESHPAAGLIGARLCDGRGRTQLSCRTRPTVGALLHRTLLLRWTGLFRRAYRACRGRSMDLATTHPVEVLMGAALFVPRAVFAECGPWDEGYTFGGEDVDLCDRVGRRYQVVYHPEVSVTHFGRVSSRRHIGFAYAHTVIGTARYLRRSGTSRTALWLYKAAVTVDAPLQWLGHAARYLWRRLCGRRDRAAKSLLALRGAGHLLTRGLLAFWRA